MKKNTDGSITLKDSAGNDVTISLQQQINSTKRALEFEKTHGDGQVVIDATQSQLDALRMEQEAQRRKR